MKKLVGFLQLLWIRLVVSCRNFIEFLKVVYFYYPNRNFRRLDLYLLRNYILQSPYQISKSFLQEKGEKEIYTYGETPLTTLDKIVRECQIQSSDVVYELGAGRARSCFWLHFFVGCRVVGVEFIPTFVKISQKVRRTFGVEGVTFLYKDILDADYTEASVIYFYGTCSDTPFIQKLIEKLKEVPSGTKIISVSYPLTSYMQEPLFELRGAFSARFTWGESTVYLQVRN
ncbi:MAG: methyltransferase domain-containing protein [Waddliaceae bacterium]